MKIIKGIYNIPKFFITLLNYLKNRLNNQTNVKKPIQETINNANV